MRASESARSFKPPVTRGCFAAFIPRIRSLRQPGNSMSVILTAHTSRGKTLCAASFKFWVSRETPRPVVTPGRSLTLYARAAIPRSLILAYFDKSDSAPTFDGKGEITDLRERARIQTILASHFQTYVVAGLGVPCRFGACLDLGVDLMIVGGSKNAQII